MRKRGVALGLVGCEYASRRIEGWSGRWDDCGSSRALGCSNQANWILTLDFNRCGVLYRESDYPVTGIKSAGGMMVDHTPHWVVQTKKTRPRRHGIFDGVRERERYVKCVRGRR